MIARDSKSHQIITFHPIPIHNDDDDDINYIDDDSDGDTNYIDDDSDDDKLMKKDDQDILPT